MNIKCSLGEFSLCEKLDHPLAYLVNSFLFYSEKGTIMKSMNLQDLFLNQARTEKIAVTIFLTNGFQFKGMVKGFDSYTIVLDCDGKQNLVYKHAVSTIIPARQISINEAAAAAAESASE